jgi:hypothetical protein
MHHRTTALLALAALALAPLTAGCSSDTKDAAKETVESAKDDAAAVADRATARTTAEALRVSLKANDKAKADGMRSVAAIQEAADDLPGDADISGIDDGDGDGLDDDGKVQVTAGDAQSCVELPAEGTDTKVVSGAC